MNIEESIIAVPTEEGEMSNRLATIRFECLVKMYDFGSRTLSNGKNLPPQWFKSEFRLTLEGIEYSDPTELGDCIKKAFHNLKKHIESYQNRDN